MAAGSTEAELQHVVDGSLECWLSAAVTRGAERAIVLRPLRWVAHGAGGLKAAPGVETWCPSRTLQVVSKSPKSGRRT